MTAWLVLAVATAAHAQQAADPAAAEEASPAPQVVDATPGYERTVRVPNEILNRRPRQVVVLPSEPVEFGEDRTFRTGGAIADLPSELRRLPEGYMVAGREARIEWQDPWYVAHLEPAEGLPDVAPLRLLPNRRLTLLEAILAEPSQPPRFVLTGRVTEFMGANYLLVEIISETLDREPRETEPPADDPAAEVDTATAAPPEETEPAEPLPTEPTGEPTAEDVLEQLLQDRPLRAVVMPEQVEEVELPPATPQDGPESVPDRGTTETTAFPEGAVLADRYGRVIESEEGWVFVFEDLGSRPRERPIPILPSRMLETAVALSDTGREGVVLHVTGEVTVYRSRNHLLLRKVMVRQDLGNLR